MIARMHLTRFTDNALRCLMVLALEPTACVPVRTVAEQMHMSYEHLVKVVQSLAELGYVETVRGRHGGVRLARPAAEIRLGQLVREAEGNFALVECFEEDGNCPVAPACRLGGMLEAALEAFFATLDQQTLADVVAPRQALVTLLARPVVSRRE